MVRLSRCLGDLTDQLTLLWPALKLGTLLKLSESTSYDLRAAYVRRPPTGKLLVFIN